MQSKLATFLLLFSFIGFSQNNHSDKGYAFFFANQDDSATNKSNMVFVQGGTFQMGSKEGSSDEQPVNDVTLDNFYISKYEITFEDFDKYCTATGKTKPDDEGWGRGERPAINIIWNDAIAYCNWLSGQEGLQKVYTISENTITANWQANGYRLPTEAEWEYAARQRGETIRFGNGKDTAYTRGINFDGSLKYKKSYSEEGTYRSKTTEVGAFYSNSLGLYDMSGNVWEWCWDWYDIHCYGENSNTNPKGPDTGSYRVIRSGSWNSSPAGVRCSNRNNRRPDYRDHIGFRLTRTAQ